MINKMKRLNLFFVAAVLAASSVFVSCNKDDSAMPTIEVQIGKGSDPKIVDNAITAKSNETVKVKITWKAEAGIAKIVLKKKTGSGNYSDVAPDYPMTAGFSKTDGTEHTEEFTVNASAADVAEVVMLYTEVTDKNKGTSGAQTSDAVEITITFTKTTTTLSSATEFEFTYTGSASTNVNVCTAADVKWSSNTTTDAVFTPNVSGNQFVMLADLNALNAITTKEGLEAAYTAGAKVTQFTVNLTTPVQQFFITKNGTTYTWVHLKSLTYAAGNSKAKIDYKQ